MASTLAAEDRRIGSASAPFKKMAFDGFPSFLRVFAPVAGCIKLFFGSRAFVGLNNLIGYVLRCVGVSWPRSKKNKTWVFRRDDAPVFLRPTKSNLALLWVSPSKQ